MKKLSNQTGDTIIETLCALAIFSVIIMGFTAVMTEISNLNRQIEISEKEESSDNTFDVNEVTITDLSVNVQYSFNILRKINEDKKIEEN